MMRKRLAVTVMVDSPCIPQEDPEFKKRGPNDSTEYNVIRAIRWLGHEVSILGIGNDVAAIVAALTEQKPDVVFNLTEQFGDDRQKDSNIAALLDLMAVPFTGSGALGLSLCRSKALCKQLLATHRLRVPGYAVFPPGAAALVPRSLKYPLVVKPVYEDGSDGISNASLVHSENELHERAAMVHERFGQPAIAEEYIDGRELYVSVLGNGRLTVLPPRELIFGNVTNGGPVLATYRLKWDKAYQEKWNIKFGFCDLDPSVGQQVARVCRKAYNVLQIHDYGRMDLRLTNDNLVYIIEANPNPNIGRDDEFAQSAAKAGIGYAALISRIMRLALHRSGVVI
ncbi:MAG: ATP-grasp domain-containing protein [Chitinispirillaceae bacterium]|nr:ATP-grasp domain-containing protein [Chitinispirillaceae bacterium]